MSFTFHSTPTVPVCARSVTFSRKRHWSTSTPSLPNAPSGPFPGGLCDMKLLCAVLCHVCALLPAHLHSVRETPSLIQRGAGEVVTTILSYREGTARLPPKSHGLLLNPKVVLPGLEWVKNVHLRGLEEGVPSMERKCQHL